MTQACISAPTGIKHMLDKWNIDELNLLFRVTKCDDASVSHIVDNFQPYLM